LVYPKRKKEKLRGNNNFYTFVEIYSNGLLAFPLFLSIPGAREMEERKH
jgi:hypothetical protein